MLDQVRELMPPRLLALALFGGCGLLGATDQPTTANHPGEGVNRDSPVSVVFVDPENFSDASDHGSGADRQVLLTLEQHFKDLGHCLPAGDKLSIRVLDVDLAGAMEWRLANYPFRALRKDSWPRLTIAYASSAGSGERQESISDIDYLRLRPLVQTDLQPLPYERRMLSTWFEQRFCKPDANPR